MGVANPADPGSAVAGDGSKVSSGTASPPGTPPSDQPPEPPDNGSPDPEPRSSFQQLADRTRLVRFAVAATLAILVTVFIVFLADVVGLEDCKDVVVSGHVLHDVCSTMPL